MIKNGGGGLPSGDIIYEGGTIGGETPSSHVVYDGGKF